MVEEHAEGYNWLSDYQKPVLSLDFDGVIHSYKSGWKSDTDIPDPPVEGAKEFLMEAAQHFEVWVHTSRFNYPGGKMAVAAWMTRHFGLEIAHAITYSEGKPPAKVHLDDRCLTFTGRWPSMADLMEFQPWYRKTGREVPSGVYRAVRVLNEALDVHPEAIEALVSHRVPCNGALAKHPSIQVGETASGWEVGMLGIINGLFGTDKDDWGFIAAEFDDAGHIRHFRVTPAREEPAE